MSQPQPKKKCYQAPSTSKTPDSINKELTLFFGEINKQGTSRNPEITKSAIYLLKNFTASHDAILEYLYNLFDEVVHNYILKLELQDKGTIAGNVATDENTIKEVSEVLLQFIRQNPSQWSSKISSWSLELLGHLSTKHANRYISSSSSNLPQILQFWMDCYPTKALIDLATSCLSTVIDSNPDLCINALLETSVQRSPHFDWVVAHIGSSFPTTVITRVLACGLKDFTTEDAFSSGSKKVSSKLSSVVGILGHLVAHHSDDIKKALLNLFYSSFNDRPKKEQLSTIPYLLHLASLSDMLANIFTSEFIEAVNVDILNKLSQYYILWKKYKISGTEDMIKVIMHLLIKCEAGGRAVHKLLDIASSSHPMYSTLDSNVKKAAGLILDHLLTEVHSRVYAGNIDVPLLRYFSSHTLKLIQTVNQVPIDTVKEEWLLYIIKLICIHTGERTSIDVIGQLLCHMDNAIFTHKLILQLEINQPDMFTKAISHLMGELKIKQIANPIPLMTHLIELGKINPKALTAALKNQIPILADQLLMEDTQYADKVFELLNLCVVTNSMGSDTLYKVASSIIQHICNILGPKRRNPESLPHQLKIAQNLLSTLCQQSSAQQMVLRMLLMEILSKNSSKYFGSKLVYKSEPKGFKQKSLFKENHSSASSAILPQSHSSVFHTGVIGDGLRTVSKIFKILLEEIVYDKQAILEIIQLCCGPSWRFPSDKLSEDKNSLVPGMKIVSLLLVELISPDVMFNGLPWPDEEFQKVTIERDLHIKRKFEEHPILWDLLTVIASIPPSLCYCSVLLRAIMALMISFWSSCQSKSTSCNPIQLELTQKLLHVMSLGQILPPPLCYIGELVSKLSPHETYCILTDTWTYMKDNVPSPALFTNKDPQTGMIWRERKRCDRQYTDRLRFILINNIAMHGNIYSKMFGKQCI